MAEMPTPLKHATALERIRRLCNATVAGIWLYQGLVPKLLGPHPDEVAMSAAFGIPVALQTAASYAAGAGEVLLGVCILLFPRRAWPQLVSAAVTAVLLIFVAVYVPRFLVGAFNPVVMNVTSMVLSAVAVMALRAKAARAE